MILMRWDNYLPTVTAAFQVNAVKVAKALILFARMSLVAIGSAVLIALSL